MAEDFIGRHFGDVDRAPEPTRFVSYLDQAATTAPIQRPKRASHEILTAASGDAVLDVGCGVGDDVRALAGIIGPTGRAVGVDFSRTLISEAHMRSRGSALPVRFARGDCCHVPFPDNAFDAVRPERKLQHIRELLVAVKEMARVVKSQGRVVDFGPDWDMMAIDSADLGLTRRIVHFRADSIASGSVGRRLSNLFRDAGLVDVEVVPIASVLPSFAAANPMLEFEAMVEKAVAAGVVSADEASRWLATSPRLPRAG